MCARVCACVCVCVSCEWRALVNECVHVLVSSYRGLQWCMCRTGGYERRNLALVMVWDRVKERHQAYVVVVARGVHGPINTLSVLPPLFVTRVSLTRTYLPDASTCARGGGAASVCSRGVAGQQADGLRAHHCFAQPSYP